jgi:chloramphenicol-sensitive protein RarD
MSDTGKGVVAMVVACLVWGVAPLYYAGIRFVPALDLAAHRILWAFVVFMLVLTLQRRPAAPFRLLAVASERRRLLPAAVLIAFNWGLFIWAIAQGRAIEAAFGYYVFPLAAVLVGRLALGERLPAGTALPLALAGAAVALLGVGIGATPWIPLSLALSFALYGAVKHGLAAGPVASVTAEAALLAPLALAFIAWRGAWPASLAETALLAGLGPLTALPLVLFTYAARRAGLGTAGLVQYLNPTIQFACAMLVLGEPATAWHWVALPMIWLALALYTAAALRRRPVMAPD